METRKHSIGIVLTLLLCSTVLSGDTWKFFFYMDASDRLADMAFKNITDMMRGAPNHNVEALLQLHAYGNTALRYRITHTGLAFVDEVILSGDGKQDFVAAATWALSHNVMDHTMIVLSNHGWGALDPRWNEDEHAWQAAEISISHDSTSLPTSCSLPDKSIKALRSRHMNHKGFMFNDLSHTYLTNSDLTIILSYVQHELLQGKKIDVVAFDTCMGSMLEVATCIAPYADYLVGVQSCALRDGFNYQEFVSVLNSGKSSRQTVTEFVEAFDEYYEKNDLDGIYTCGALDLSQVSAVNNALNDAVEKLLSYQGITQLLQHAEAESPRFCLWPIYTDLVAFCKLIEAQLLAAGQIYASDDLIYTLHQLYNAVNRMVVAHCGGSTTTGSVHGFSIYLPHNRIDSSYVSSLFAQQSKWVELLRKICPETKS